MVKKFLCFVMGAVLLSGCISIHETKHVECGSAGEEPKQAVRHEVSSEVENNTCTDQRSGM
jgi:hypothetical protein